MAPMFIPGPVDVADEVMQAQTRPMLPHRSAEFEEIFHRAEGNSRKLLKTEHRVFITASSGTGIHEAAVRNFANSKVLACVNGAFGSRWHDVAVSNGKSVTKLETDWQEPITADLVAETLKDGDYGDRTGSAQRDLHWPDEPHPGYRQGCAKKPVRTR